VQTVDEVMAAGALDQLIEKGFAAGKWDWPQLERPTWIDYSSHVRNLQASATELEQNGSDLFLALGCGLGDRHAVRGLQRRYFPALSSTLARAGFDSTAREDVLQQTLLHLCAGDSPRMLTYAGKASLASWLTVTSMRFALNMRTRNGSASGCSAPLEFERLVSEEDTPEIRLAVEKARPAFQAALQNAIVELPQRDRTLLRLYFLDRLTIDGIGNMYGVHRATAARWISDIRRKILRQVQSILSRDLGLGASEFDSLAFLIRSQLQLSLVRVFGVA
jgi:RNA polymerase sigma-70 factor (ECF subfamily)